MRAALSRDFYLVTAANFLFFLNFASFFLLPIHLVELGATERTIGFAMGIGGVAGLLILPFLGVLLDRVNRRAFVTVGATAMALASFAYVLVDEVGPVLYVLRFIQGVSFTSAFVTASTLVADLAPIERRGQALGIFGISTLITHAIAPSLGEMIARHYGFTTLFAVAGGLGLAGAALTLAVHVPRVQHAVADRDGGGAVLRHPVLARIAGAMIACGMGFGVVLTFVPTFAHAIGVARVAPFFLAYTVAAVAMRLGLGSLSDRIGRRRVLLPATASLAVAVLALAFVDSIVGLVLIGFAFGAGHGLVYPTANALMVDHSRPSNLGRVQTLFAGSFSVGVAASSFVFGAVIERFGYSTAFALAAGIVVVGVALIWRTPERARAVTARSIAVSAASVPTQAP
jgi:MFS family permease